MAFFKKNKKSHYSSMPSIKKVVAESNGKIKKKEIPKGLWDKCKKCSATVYTEKRKDNLNICPECGFHYPLTAFERIELLTDKDSFKEIDENMESVNALKFEGTASYDKKLEASKKKSGLKDAVICGTALLDKQKYAIGVMDFRFLGASMGSVVGEKLTRLTELATKENMPLLIVTASGGARMYEGMLSLMQMAKTSGALKRHQNAGLPYIVIMTHPTYAGVTASFASLGDLTIAEPKAMIGFAGPRVIRDTAQSVLPDDFQTSEFLLEKGMIDRIVDRKELRNELSLYIEYFSGSVKKKSNKK